MAGRDHDAAVGLEMGGREVHHLGAAQADVEDFCAGLGYAFGDGIGQFRAGQANVAPEHNLLSFQELGGGVADAVGNVGVQLVRDLATDVVGLEAVNLDGHVSSYCAQLL